MGFSQSLFILIAWPQSLHVINVLPAMFLVVVYMVLTLFLIGGRSGERWGSDHGPGLTTPMAFHEK